LSAILVMSCFIADFRYNPLIIKDLTLISKQAVRLALNSCSLNERSIKTITLHKQSVSKISFRYYENNLPSVYYILVR